MLAPGVVIVLAASCWIGGQEVSSAERKIVVLNPRFVGRVFHCSDVGGRRYLESDGASRHWRNALIAGVRVRFPVRVGAGWVQVDGVAGDRGSVVIDGGEYQWSEVARAQ